MNQIFHFIQSNAKDCLVVVAENVSSLKKLFLILITLLLGVMSSNVMSQTIYDFSITFTGGGAPGTYTGTATVDPSNRNNITNYSNLMYRGSSIQSQWDGIGVSTVTSNGGYINSPTDYHFSFTWGEGSNGLIYSSSSGYNYSIGSFGDTYSDTFSAKTIGTGGGEAPEIDGSLAPKVGFLLGCLFLMFGRNKQNIKPMMTA